MTLTEERKKLIEAACKKIFDELEEIKAQRSKKA